MATWSLGRSLNATGERSVFVDVDELKSTLDELINQGRGHTGLILEQEAVLGRRSISVDHTINLAG